MSISYPTLPVMKTGVTKQSGISSDQNLMHDHEKALEGNRHSRAERAVHAAQSLRSALTDLGVTFMSPRPNCWLR